MGNLSDNPRWLNPPAEKLEMNIKTNKRSQGQSTIMDVGNMKKVNMGQDQVTMMVSSMRWSPPKVMKERAMSGYKDHHGERHRQGCARSGDVFEGEQSQSSSRDSDTKSSRDGKEGIWPTDAKHCRQQDKAADRSGDFELNLQGVATNTAALGIEDVPPIIKKDARDEYKCSNTRQNTPQRTASDESPGDGGDTYRVADRKLYQTMPESSQQHWGSDPEGGARYTDPAVNAYHSTSRASAMDYHSTQPTDADRYDFRMDRGLNVAVYTADLTTVEVDAIVNPSNPDLNLLGGVSYAIRRAAQDNLQEQCTMYISLNGPLKVS